MSSLMFNNSSLPTPFQREMREIVRNVNHTFLYIQAFICIFGLVGNLLALIVINQKTLRNTSSAVFITYMAIFDSAVLIFHGINLAKPPRNVFLLCSLTYFTDLAMFCANWVLVIITLERCVAVYSPFLAKRFCTIYSARRSVYILLTIAILLFSITFPFIYEMKNVSKKDKCHINKKAALLVRIYQSILFIGIPDILLLSNLFTVFSLCRRRQRLSLCYINDGHKLEMRITDVHSNRKQRQLTIMLVTVSLSFYLFTTPAMIAFITEIKPPEHKEINRFKRSFLFSQFSVAFSELNNATNFLFYCFTGQRFRHVAKQTLYRYSRQIKTFYYRYILCDKEYHQTPFYQQNSNSTGNNTIMSNRSSCSPHYQKHNFRVATA